MRAEQPGRAKRQLLMDQIAVANGYKDHADAKAQIAAKEAEVLGIEPGDLKPDGNTMAACDKGCPGCCMTFSPDPAICPPEVFKGWTEERDGIDDPMAAKHTDDLGRFKSTQDFIEYLEGR